MIVLTPKVEIDFGAGFVDVSEDVVSDVQCSWGIHGWQPKDRVADPGAASFDLDNNNTNSAETIGYYTIGHPDVRAGFATGAPVRISVVHPFYGTRVLWVGTIDGADPAVGVKDPRTRVRCVDWMDDAARAKLSGVSVQTNVQSDALFLTMVASLDKQPPGGVSAGSGSDVYPYALDNTQDESSKVIGEFQKLAQSEFGLVYVSRGVLNFEGRRRRSGGGVASYAFDDLTLVGMSMTNGRDDVLNRIQVSVHPRRVDASPTVLFKLANSIQLLRGTSVTISCPYRDQNQQSQRIGGKDIIAPVAGTDFSFRPAADGSGANLDAQLSINGVYGGNTAELTITNNGPLDGYIPAAGLQLRGTGLYDFEPIISDQSDAASIAALGLNPVAYDMPYQSSVDNARDMAAFILSLNKDAVLRPKTITWIANWEEELVQLLYSVDISSLVSVTSPRMGMDAVRCYVNGFTVSISHTGIVKVTNDLAQADTTAFWILEVDGRTELDETTVLGYGLFVAGWILDQSTLGTDTFLV